MSKATTMLEAYRPHTSPSASSESDEADDDVMGGSAPSFFRCSLPEVEEELPPVSCSKKHRVNHQYISVIAKGRGEERLCSLIHLPPELATGGQAPAVVVAIGAPPAHRGKGTERGYTVSYRWEGDWWQ